MLDLYSSNLFYPEETDANHHGDVSNIENRKESCFKQVHLGDIKHETKLFYSKFITHLHN